MEILAQHRLTISKTWLMDSLLGRYLPSQEIERFAYQWFMDFSGNGIHGNVGGPTAPFRDDMLDFDRLPCSDFETWKPGEIFFPKKFSTNHRVVILRSSLLRDYIFEERLEEKRGICISVEIPEELPSSLTAGREIHA